MTDHSLTHSSHYVMTRRVGLMGNPSDGFNGKTIAMSISNFWAEVTLVESQTLVTPTLSSGHTLQLKHVHLSHAVQTTHTNFCNSAGFSPSSSQWPHRVWKLARSVLHQQEGRVCTRRAGIRDGDGQLQAWNVKTFLSVVRCRYLGGLRLLQATCKKFYQFCSKQGWDEQLRQEESNMSSMLSF